MLEKLVVAIVSMVVSTASARADDRFSQAKQQVKAADIDYRLGRFAEALEEYTRAYELYPVPPLLFNIGQCHKNLRDFAKAKFFFEGYLRDDPKAWNRDLVEDLIREANAELAKSRSTGETGQPTAPVQPTAPPAITPPMAFPPALAPPIAPPRPVEPPSDAVAPGRSVVWPSVLVGGGVAALAGGGVLYYYGRKRGPEEKFVYEDTRLLGGTMMVLGGAAIVTGAIVWLRGSSAAPVAAITAGAGYLGWADTF
jgi:tetratricopeptide (TPR) repeat protein